MSYTVDLLKDLVRIPSNPNDTNTARQILERVLIELDGFTIERFTNNNVVSALVYNAKTRPAKFRIILNAHLDVIPGKPEQYTPKQSKDKLNGVGAMDMKASVAVFIDIFRRHARALPYPIALQLTTDEEVGGFDGTKYQVAQGIKADFVLAGEPTNFDIVHQAKGILQVKVSTHGLSAHGAYPWRGQNAVWQMYDVLSKLQAAYPNPQKEAWATTVNLAHISTPNESFNKVPDACEAWLDIRMVPGDRDAVLTTLKALLPKNASLEIIANEPALQTSPSDPFITKLAQSASKFTGKTTTLRGANGTSDARHFSAQGCPGVEFGPIGDGIGADEEWVSLPSLVTYTTIIEDFLQQIIPEK
ncbi:MAG TPA: M20/M25/M40 family metallo-hydrolase [Candidatus Saccharimonadia bacterium]